MKESFTSHTRVKVVPIYYLLFSIFLINDTNFLTVPQSPWRYYSNLKGVFSNGTLYRILDTVFFFFFFWRDFPIIWTKTNTPWKRKENWQPFESRFKNMMYRRWDIQERFIQKFSLRRDLFLTEIYLLSLFRKPFVEKLYITVRSDHSEKNKIHKKETNLLQHTALGVPGPFFLWTSSTTRTTSVSKKIELQVFIHRIPFCTVIKKILLLHFRFSLIQ